MDPWLPNKMKRTASHDSNEGEGGGSRDSRRRRARKDSRDSPGPVTMEFDPYGFQGMMFYDAPTILESPQQVPGLTDTSGTTESDFTPGITESDYTPGIHECFSMPTSLDHIPGDTFTLYEETGQTGFPTPDLQDMQYPYQYPYPWLDGPTSSTMQEGKTGSHNVPFLPSTTTNVDFKTSDSDDFTLFFNQETTSTQQEFAFRPTKSFTTVPTNSGSVRLRDRRVTTSDDPTQTQALRAGLTATEAIRSYMELADQLDDYVSDNASWGSASDSGTAVYAVSDFGPLIVGVDNPETSREDKLKLQGRNSDPSYSSFRNMDASNTGQSQLAVGQPPFFHENRGSLPENTPRGHFPPLLSVYSQAVHDQQNEEREPQKYKSLTDVEVPNFKDQEKIDRLRMKHLEVEDWRSRNEESSEEQESNHPVAFLEEEKAAITPVDMDSESATAFNMKPHILPGIENVEGTTESRHFDVMENLPAVEGLILVAVDEPLGRIASPSNHSRAGSDSSQNPDDISAKHNKGPAIIDLASRDSKGQDYMALDSSYQASTSTEKTDVSLMDYVVDQSDDDLGPPSVDGSEYADAKTEERLSNPRSYFTKLEKLEREIYEASSVWIHKPCPDKTTAKDSCLVLPLGVLHEHSHTAKKHKCPYCDTEFTQHHNLKSHLLTHSQERPYICQTCQMKFKRLHDLKRHTELHSSERPHICPKCDRKFARGDALARHSKGHGSCAGGRANMDLVGGDDDFEGSHMGEGDDSGMAGIVYTKPTEQSDEECRFNLPSIKAEHVRLGREAPKSYTLHPFIPNTYSRAGPRSPRQLAGEQFPSFAEGSDSGNSLNAEFQSDILTPLRECHSIIQQSCHNICKLQKAGFCGEYISILVEDDHRAGVAHLLRIHFAEVVELDNQFSKSLIAFESLEKQYIAQSRDAKDLGTLCEDLLTRIGLHPASNTAQLQLWLYTTQVIDIAILSYVGAHIERFDRKFLGGDLLSVPLPSSLIPHYKRSDQRVSGAGGERDATQVDSVLKSLCTFRRRRLQCLDNLLGGLEVWVFHKGHNVQNNERLSLSTDIDTLTDIWGPLWKILRSSSPSQVERFNIGNGSIVPWTPLASSDSPVPRDNEVYCHWIPHKKWNSEDIEEHQTGLNRKHFLDTDRLLIGAKEHGLLVNKECELTVAYLRDIKSTLHDESALQRPGTDRPRRYVDSYALQVQGSVLSAVSGAATVTYKRRNGQNMKDTLVERWRNTKNPNPGELEAFCGVEVSLCTQNARRRRLLELLNSTTMRKYLKGIFFEWVSDECESAYFDSLSSRHTFRKFWNRSREWRRSASEAISLCLDRLELTGIDEDNGELSAFWADTFEEDEYSPTEEWLVKLVRKDHSWTRFLRDSPEVLTMAVMDSKCLDFNDLTGYGRRCRRPRSVSDYRSKVLDLGFPVLETALHVNERVAQSLIKDGKLEKVETNKPGIYGWSTEKLKKNTKFSLGNQGTLAVYAQSNCYCPPIMSWHPIICEALQEFKNVGVRENMIGGHEEKHHHEYISGSWSCKPLRVLVLSNSTGKERVKEPIRDRLLNVGYPLNVT